MGFGTTFGSTLGADGGAAEGFTPEEATPHIPTLTSVIGLNMSAGAPVHEDLGWQRLLSTPLNVADTLESDVDERSFADASWQRLLSTPLNVADTLESDVDERSFKDASWQRLLSTSLNVADTLESDEEPSRPFIDGLSPCTIGSEFRNSALAAAKINSSDLLEVITPAPGGSGSAGDTVIIPCGDRVPEWYGTNPEIGQSQPANTPAGLDDLKTIITVNSAVIYKNGSALGGWTVDKPANNIKGFNYGLTGPGGILPLGLVTIGVYLEGVRSDYFEYSFTSLEGDPPYITNQDPAPSDTGVPRDKVLYLEVVDDVSGVDLSQTDLYVEGNLAFVGATSTFVAPYNGASSAVASIAKGYSFYVHKTSDWESYKEISVGAESKDGSGNILELAASTYYFRIEDYEAPTFHNESPTGVGASKTTSIFVEIRETSGIGVNTAEINANVSGISAVIGGVFQAGFSGSIVPNAFNGYNLTIDKDTDYASFASIPVSISAKDLSGNLGSINWTFQVEDYLGPLILPINPINGQIQVAITENISVNLNDEDSIDMATVVIEVDKTGTGTSFEVAFTGGSFTPDFDGPSSMIAPDGTPDDVYIIIDPVNLLPPNTLIYVRITARDPTGNNERL